MSETYQSKRERRQRVLGSLPAELRKHISLRNVEAVAALSPQAQDRLMEAFQAGLKQLSRAVEQLRVNPNTSVTDLLDPPAQVVTEPSPQQIQNNLADLIQMCFPDMPRISAEALADADVLDIARGTAQAHQDLFESDHLHTDFVLVVMVALLHQTLESLEEILSDTPACIQIITQSSLPWKPNNWRKQNA
ncbi:MAG: hypothetical protein HY863_09200 [Chloroflexi bacterium]|nr:hypothetical protein [Chloroflexota bacterium]